jgi:hypothetical protein
MGFSVRSYWVQNPSNRYDFDREWKNKLKNDKMDSVWRHFTSGKNILISSDRFAWLQIDRFMKFIYKVW